jgi:trehalose 6-phosphate synthase/phosphatase
MSRCLLISNRLPLTYNDKTQEFTASSGGLVSAIKGLKANDIGHRFEWMGIMTDDIDNDKIEQLKNIPFGEFKCHPIVVPKDSYHHYYNCFCNNVIWPLFHYERSLVMHSEQGWKSYQEINEIVAEAIIKVANDDDIIWVHDFHFYLVPGLVREKRPDIKIGFFLHIPFPSSEIFRELPQRKEIIHSLAQCDLVGFHDLSYMNHFQSSLQRILGESQDLNERKWGVYPISIDTEHFMELTQKTETREFVNKYKATKKEMKWILGVDRLDYIKGLKMKLQAFCEFLRRYPEQKEKVQMVQIVIPSRTDVPEYLQLKEQVEQLVSSINGEFGSPSYMPIYYLYHSVSEYELSALYQLSEVMHIGSRRDGMNLVCLEYVVSQQMDSPGTLLLSEFTGAHSTMSYALSINPWNIEETADKIQDALTRDLDQRKSEMKSMQDFLIKYNASEWAKFFLRDLLKDGGHQKLIPLSKEGNFQWMKEIKGKKILFFCDFDGTLTPIRSLPSQVSLTEKTKDVIKNITGINDCEFVIVSGRDKDYMENQFIGNGLQISLGACHGAYQYKHESGEWINLAPHDSIKWKESVIDVFKMYSSRTPGSFFEDKGHAIAWHYRNSPKEFSDFLANKLYLELEETLKSQPVVVTKGKKVIEVRSLHASKGLFVQHWIQNTSIRPDIIIALGDDNTDEDMFLALEEQEIPHYCIRVGKEKTAASFMIKDQTNVNLFLNQLIHSIQP